MEVPIQVGVRVRSDSLADNNLVCLRTNPYLNKVTFGNEYVFPVTYALPQDCTQQQIFSLTVSPLLNDLFDGCDISVVTTGQAGQGKTYTLFGPGLHCALSETEYGIVPRCIREIFARLTHHSERNSILSISWTQICGENIQDLLGAGSVQCCTISDAFQWMQLGMSNRAPHHAHTLFTITLEQEWIGTDSGLLQHRISTASFSDLTSSEKVYIVGKFGEAQAAIPTDTGLLALDRVVTSLVELSLGGCYHQNYGIQYTQSTLTTLLKDSFGGRAKTLVLACVSPYLNDFNETLYTLQFISKVQNLRNYVTTNSFSNVIMKPLNDPVVVANEDEVVGSETEAGKGDMFGLQFAASQWLKLVSNAEDLFNKLVSTSALSDQDKDQICEWLFLKQECEECLSGEDTISIGVTEPRRSLGPIEEETESDHETIPTTPLDDSESEETDVDIMLHPELLEQIDILKDKFKEQTDQLAQANYTIQTQVIQPSKLTNSFSTLHLNGARTRRKSINPEQIDAGTPLLQFDNFADAINDSELPTSPIADRNSNSSNVEEVKDPVKKIAALNQNLEVKQNRIRQAVADLEGIQKQMSELNYTIEMKEELIKEMLKNSQTRTYAKEKFEKKQTKLELEYYKRRTELTQIEKELQQCKKLNERSDLRTKSDKYRNLTLLYEKRLKDIESVKQIPEESTRKVFELENSLHTSKKQMERLQKQMAKGEKRKARLEQELLVDKEKVEELKKSGDTDRKRDLRGHVSARISYLNQVLKEKSIDLERTADNDASKESLRHEIRNLRRTRDSLIEQRCHLDHKLQKEKMLTDLEERELLECEEAIEAIDAAIEYKNELICGRKRMDITRIEREKGEVQLMQRLMKLSENEMRTLLYKYFEKVIDLRDSSKKIEMQLVQLEREYETSAWRVQALSHALQQSRLEGERRIVLLQRQHEDKLNLLLRHFTQEAGTSSSSSNSGELLTKAMQEESNRFDLTKDLSAFPPKNLDQTVSRYKSPGTREDRMITKYRGGEEGGRTEKNRFIARFQELTRYHTEKRKQDSSTTIPSQNLKQLQSSNVQPPTKVTRQKNKLIIQQGKPNKYS